MTLKASVADILPAPCRLKFTHGFTVLEFDSAPSAAVVGRQLCDGPLRCILEMR